MINKKGVEEIILHYNLGSLKKLGKIFKDDHASFGRAISTNKGKYFLKDYRVFDKYTLEGLKLIQYLQRKNYPTNKLVLSKYGKPCIQYNNHNIALFGFIEEKEKLDLNDKQVKELGKYLGLLHKSTTDLKLQEGKFGWNYFNKLIKNHYLERGKAPNELQKILEYIYRNMKNVRCNPKMPLAANHVEFTPEHVRFKGNKLVHIIDWDIINRDFCYYDIGTSLTSCFTSGKIDYRKINFFLKAYNDERKLTSWEKEHIFEALQYGCFKFCIWTLTNTETDKLEIKYKFPQDVGRVKTLMKVSKEEFQRNLES